jgi:hypothetical protein
MLAGVVPVAHADHFVASQNRQLDLAILAISDPALSRKLGPLVVPELSEADSATLERAMDEVS